MFGSKIAGLRNKHNNEINEEHHGNENLEKALDNLWLIELFKFNIDRSFFLTGYHLIHL